MKNSILSFAKTFYFIIRQCYIRLRELLFAVQPSDFKKIPIIINNFNRVSYLRKLVSYLDSRGYTNIYIIDNNSSYPELLDYYDKTTYHVFRLDKNYGYLSLWKSGLYKQFKNQYFVYTDSDVIPSLDCPDDFLKYFYDLMQKYPRASKVGFGLNIHDLPDCFSKKCEVVEWESQFWEKPLEPNVYLAPIDTTFALYRPNVKGPAYFHDFMIRTGNPYTANHLPWYSDDKHLSDEDLYYIQHSASSTHWTQIIQSNL